MLRILANEILSCGIMGLKILLSFELVLASPHRLLSNIQGRDKLGPIQLQSLHNDRPSSSAR